MNGLYIIPNYFFVQKLSYCLACERGSQNPCTSLVDKSSLGIEVWITASFKVCMANIPLSKKLHICFDDSWCKKMKFFLNRELFKLSEEKLCHYKTLYLQIRECHIQCKLNIHARCHNLDWFIVKQSFHKKKHKIMMIL